MVTYWSAIMYQAVHLLNPMIKYDMQNSRHSQNCYLRFGIDTETEA